MVARESFVKDVIAIGSGACLGTLAAQALEVFWFFGLFGVLVGGISGYVFRLIMDPERIVWAGRAARRQLLWTLQRIKRRWTPVPGWENRIVPDVYKAIANGGIAGVLVGGSVYLIFILWHGKDVRYENLNIGALEAIETYIFAALSTAFVFILAGLDSAFFSDEKVIQSRRPPIEELRKDALCLNIIAIHFIVLGLGIILSFFLVRSAFRYIAKIPRAFLALSQITFLFLKNFIRLLHSATYTSCAFYAALTTLLVFIIASRDPVFLIAAWGAGGIMGAGMRRVVLVWLPPEFEVSPRQ